MFVVAQALKVRGVCNEFSLLVDLPTHPRDPADALDSPALSSVISDLIFTFTPDDYAGLCPAFSNCFCPNLSAAKEYRSRKNNL